MCFEKLQEIVKCTTWNISCYEFISKGNDSQKHAKYIVTMLCLKK